MGNFGARERLNYTALGDSVNLASVCACVVSRDDLGGQAGWLDPKPGALKFWISPHRLPQGI